MTPRAVIYCRVSTKEQTQNLSLPTQRAEYAKYCARNGYAVAETFIDEGESAKTADRPELIRLLEFCRKNKGRVQAVVVYNITRFARQHYDHAFLRTALLQLGITLRSVTEPIDDSPAGKLMEGMLAAIAQFDNDQKAERTTTGMRTALELGRWTFQAPIGYVNSRSDFGPSLIPEPERADLIRIAFQRVAQGDRLADVLRDISAAGLRTRSNAPLSTQTFHAMLRNPVYTGRIVVKKWNVDRAGDFAAIVDEVTFQRVQRRLERRQSDPRSYVKDRADFALRRLLRCAHCTRPLTGSWSRGRRERYGYYHCPKCAGVRGRREYVEAGFVALLERLQPDQAFMRLFREIVLDAWREAHASSAETATALNNRVSDLRAKLDSLDEAFIYQRSIDRATYERQRDRIREEITLAELAVHDARIETIDIEGVLAFAEHILANAARLWLEGTLDQRRALQHAIFPDGVPFDGKNFGTAATCLAFKQLQATTESNEGLASLAGFELMLKPTFS